MPITNLDMVEANEEKEVISEIFEPIPVPPEISPDMKYVDGGGRRPEDLTYRYDPRTGKKYPDTLLDPNNGVDIHKVLYFENVEQVLSNALYDRDYLEIGEDGGEKGGKEFVVSVLTPEDIANARREKYFGQK